MPAEVPFYQEYYWDGEDQGDYRAPAVQESLIILPFSLREAEILGKPNPSSNLLKPDLTTHNM